MGRQGTSRHMDDAGKLAARDFIHIGNHQQQALGSRKGGGQRTCSQGTMHRTGCTAFGLHLGNTHGLAE